MCSNGFHAFKICLWSHLHRTKVSQYITRVKPCDIGTKTEVQETSQRQKSKRQVKDGSSITQVKSCKSKSKNLKHYKIAEYCIGMQGAVFFFYLEEKVIIIHKND